LEEKEKRKGGKQCGRRHQRLHVKGCTFLACKPWESKSQLHSNANSKERWGVLGPQHESKAVFDCEPSAQLDIDRRAMRRSDSVANREAHGRTVERGQ